MPAFGRIGWRLLLALAAFSALPGCGFSSPRAPFDARTAPSAPDYANPVAWLAFPGRDGLERSAPKGLPPIVEAEAPADVFFIHPTTYRANNVWNAPWDASDDAAPLNPAVLLGQVSAFDGCCRFYAPRYRQATLTALSKSQPAVDLAYADVARAFRDFIVHHNNGRPFIIASHSQGTMHAVRLLQAEVLGTPLQHRLVAAYLIGGYAPADFAEVGLPICDGPRQTGCIVSWNTSKVGAGLARLVINNKTYWWRGAEKSAGQAPAICVNPLTWRAQGPDQPPAAAAANPGSLPFPKAPFPAAAITLSPLTPRLTGARCHNGMLEVEIPHDAPDGFSDTLSRLTGSYHLNDYGIFYGAIRANAVERVDAWTSAHVRSAGSTAAHRP
jgi:hypothetical protein